MRVTYSSLFILFFIILFSPTARSQNIPSKYSGDQAVITQGQNLFQLKCAACHNFRQQGIGPSLSGVTEHRSGEWLAKFIQNSQELVKSGDKQAVALFARYKVPMPANDDLSKAELRALLSYINTHKDLVNNKTGKDAFTAKLAAPITNPVPLKIQKAKTVLYLEEVATAPATEAKLPLARINDMYVLKGRKERLFIQEMRGKLYELRDTGFITVFDLALEKPGFISAPGLGSGFGSYTFHPDFYNNGLFYTSHTEKAGSAVADFGFNDSISVALQWVVTEWKLDDPYATTFSANPRELFRINMPFAMHGMQQITFNPLSKPGSPDYGLLYIGIGDGGSTEGGYPQLCSSNKTPWASVLRIDPAGNNSVNKQYGIPAINPFANDGDKKTAGEIFARGFRNPNRITWAPDGKMLITDIGQANIEELNIGIAGGDYGWPAREGSFVMNYKGKMNLVYALPSVPTKFLSPVAQYDHDEGNAISGGFVYTGAIAELRNKYVFGDIVKGRVFGVDYDRLKQGRQETIQEFDLVFGNTASTFVEVTKSAKADLRFGVGIGNELYLYTKTDGKIWRVTDCRVQ